MDILDRGFVGTKDFVSELRIAAGCGIHSAADSCKD